MKRSIILLALVVAACIGTASAQATAGGQGRGGRRNTSAPDAKASGPIADVVQRMVTAFNSGDSAFFQKAIAPEAVWLDEDGHHLLAAVWINRLLSSTPPRKLSITNLRVGTWDTAG